MESTPCQLSVLAIDIGGQGCRASIFTTSGKNLYATEASYPTRLPQADFVEQPIQAVLDAIDSCLKDISRYKREQPNITITSAGMACQGSNLLCWDSQTGQPFTDVLSWQDTRGKGILTTSDLDNDKCCYITGLNQSAHYGASKYSWCITHVDQVKSAKDQDRLSLGPLASYIAQHICDPAQSLLKPTSFVDPSHATRTFLWDLRNQYWSNDLLSSFQISASLLPTPCNHYHNYGILKGLDVPLSIINRDQSAALFAQGEPDPEITYINMGTGIFIQRPLKNLPEAADMSLQLSPLLFDNNEKLFTVEGSVHSGMAVKAELESRLNKTITPEAIDAALLKLPLQACEFILITAAGLGSPYWRDDIDSIISPSFTAEQVIAAWMQSLIFLTQINIDTLNQVTTKSNKIAVSGGLSRYNDLCQYLADLSQLPVIRHEYTNSTLRGIAYLAADRPKSWGAQVETDHHQSQTFIPRKNTDIKQSFQQWRTELNEYVNRTPPPKAPANSIFVKDKPIFVGHRGDIHQHQENSIAAILASLKGGLTQVEFDIQISKDGIPVLLHDPDLERIHHHAGSIFDIDFQQAPIQLESLWELIDNLTAYPQSHCYIEIKHDSIDYWGAETVLSCIRPLLRTSLDYTLLARSQALLSQARKEGHKSIGANVRHYSEHEKQQLRQLAPDFLVINHERIPTSDKLWQGDWQWMIYEVTDNNKTQQLLQQGASHMISFHANQLHHSWSDVHA
jgi:glycerol kinase